MGHRLTGPVFGLTFGTALSWLVSALLGGAPGALIGGSLEGWVVGEALAGSGKGNEEKGPGAEGRVPWCHVCWALGGLLGRGITRLVAERLGWGVLGIAMWILAYSAGGFVTGSLVTWISGRIQPRDHRAGQPNGTKPSSIVIGRGFMYGAASAIGIVVALAAIAVFRALPVVVGETSVRILVPALFGLGGLVCGMVFGRMALRGQHVASVNRRQTP